MKIRFTYLAVLLCTLAHPVAGQMAAVKESFSRYMFDQVHIEGKTNVNDFHMEYRESGFCEVPGDFRKGNSMIEIEIPADQIEADSKLMLKDFLELINADEYPTVTIQIDSDEITFDQAGESDLKNIGISMNGITKQFRSQTYSDACFGNQWCLTGKLTIKLTDFNIKPPSKFLGMVKVRDEIFINFRILFS